MSDEKVVLIKFTETMSRDFLLFIVFGLITIVNSANILLLLGCPSPSHHIWNTRIVNALAARGHNLTVLSADLPKSSPPKNVHYLHLDKIYSALYDEVDLEEFVVVGKLEFIQFWYLLQTLSCKGATQSKGFEILKNYPNNFKFDLVINDITAATCLLGFLHKFNYPPLIGVSPFKYTSDVVDIVGGHSFPAYVPIPHLPYNANMTFLQRFINTALVILDYLYKEYIFIPEYNKLLWSNFGKNLPTVRDLAQRAAVMLLNIHPATDFPIPLPPNLIEVGGLQIRDPQPLPKELETFISKSANGTVLISFGTNIDAKTFGDDKQQIIVDAVKKFPTYNFIWKFEKDLSNGRVPNLLVKGWLPQNDVLSHPKVKAFVTHGGGLSTHESTWHGVPMIVVPFFMDQKTNSYGSIVAGVAKEVNVLTMTVQDLEEAIRTVLEDPAYMESMQIRSQRFRDRPMKPLDTAIWWIEYIMRDPNPIHLRSPTISLGFWRSNCYDFILYALISVVIIVYISYKVIKKLANSLSADNKRIKVKFNK